MMLFIQIMIAATLRLQFLFARGTYWFDEMFTVHFSSLPLLQALPLWVMETNPPFHTLLTRFWIQFFSNAELVTRSSSLLLGLGSILLLYYLGKQLFDKNVSLLATGFLSLAPLHIFVSTEIRAYSLSLFLTLLSFSLFLKLVKKYDPKYFLLYFFCQTVLLYTHLTLILVPLIQFLSLYVFDSNTYTRKNFLRVNITAFALLLFWLLPSLATKFDPSSLEGWFFSPTASSGSILSTITSFFLFLPNSVSAKVIAYVMVLLLFFYLLKFIRTKQKDIHHPTILFLSIWAFMPPLVSNIFGIAIPKYSFYAAPALFLLTGFFIASLNKYWHKATILLIYLFLLVPTLTGMLKSPIFHANDYVQYMVQHQLPQSIVLTVPFREELVLTHYLTSEIPVLGVYPLDDSLSFEERIVRYNWKQLPATKEDLDRTLSDVNEKNQVYYYTTQPNTDQVSTWLTARGFTKQDTFTSNDVSNIYLHRYERP